MTPITSPVWIIPELLDAEIIRGRHIFIFPATQLSKDDPIIHEVAMRVGCDNLDIGMEAIKKLDKRTNLWKTQYQTSPVRKVFEEMNIPFPPHWFMASL